jgi:hypothetical protein
VLLQGAMALNEYANNLQRALIPSGIIDFIYVLLSVK